MQGRGHSTLQEDAVGTARALTVHAQRLENGSTTRWVVAAHAANEGDSEATDDEMAAERTATSSPSRHFRPLPDRSDFGSDLNFDRRPSSGVDDDALVLLDSVPGPASYQHYQRLHHAHLESPVRPGWVPKSAAASHTGLAVAAPNAPASTSTPTIPFPAHAHAHADVRVDAHWIARSSYTSDVRAHGHAQRHFRVCTRATITHGPSTNVRTQHPPTCSNHKIAAAVAHHSQVQNAHVRGCGADGAKQASRSHFLLLPIPPHWCLHAGHGSSPRSNPQVMR